MSPADQSSVGWDAKARLPIAPTGRLRGPSRAPPHDRTVVTDERALRHAMRDYARALLEGFDVGPVLYRLTDQVVDGAAAV